MADSPEVEDPYGVGPMAMFAHPSTSDPYDLEGRTGPNLLALVLAVGFFAVVAGVVVGGGWFLWWFAEWAGFR